LKRIIALLLAYLFLQGNIGLAQIKHFCGDLLAIQKTSLFTAEASCGMESDEHPSTPSCEKPSHPTKKSCCHNEVQQLQVDQSLKSPSMASVDLVPFVLFVISFAFGHFSLLAGRLEVAPSGYSPPHRFTHLRLRAFLQVFRN
jgi:hypothetical protein